MKKFLCMVLVGIMAVACLAGCGQKKGDQLEAIKKAGKIVIAMEGQWAPWTYHDETEKLVGYDTEVGQAIAKKLGVEAEFVEGEWDGLFTGMDSGKYDIIINGVDITDERKAKYDFSTPYAYDRTVLIVKEDNTSITKFEDLKGKKTANSLGSVYADMAADFGAEVQNVDTLAQTIDMLLAGRIDATLNAETSYIDYKKEKPEAAIKVVSKTESANEIAIPMRKGNETAALREAINKAIEELRADGTLKALSEKYFGTDISGTTK